MKTWIVCFVAAAFMWLLSGHAYAQKELQDSKIEEISRNVSELKTQQAQILEDQKRILEALEEVQKTVNRIRGM